MQRPAIVVREVKVLVVAARVTETAVVDFGKHGDRRGGDCPP
jgi:hypothetical protein